jgi:hypothetical protein
VPGGGEAAATTVTAADANPITLDLAKVTRGALTFTFHGTGASLALTDITGTVRISGFDQEADITFDANVNEKAAKSS